MKSKEGVMVVVVISWSNLWGYVGGLARWIGIGYIDLPMPPKPPSPPMPSIPGMPPPMPPIPPGRSSSGAASCSSSSTH